MVEAISLLEAVVDRKGFKEKEDRLAAVYLVGKIVDRFNITEEDQRKRFIEVQWCQTYLPDETVGDVVDISRSDSLHCSVQQHTGLL